MAINPDINMIEMLKEAIDSDGKVRKEMELKILDIPPRSLPDGFVYQDANTGNLVRHDGRPIPKHWSIFREDELVIIKDYTFKVVYINESSITFEPISPLITNDNK